MRTSFFGRAVILGAALLGAAAGVEAGTVYVPMAGAIEVQGVRYQSQVLVSNPAGLKRSISAQLIPTEADGTTTRLDRGSVAVGPQSTRPLPDAATTDDFGLLELTGAPQLVVGASLVGPGGSRGAELPVISAANLFAADATADVLGLARTGGVVSHFVLVNLGHTAASCNLVVRRAGGSQIGATAAVSLAPLSQRSFADVLGLLGESKIAGARVSARCNQPFYAFGTLFEQAAGEAYLLPPAQSTASTLSPPSPGVPGCPPGASACFTRAGAFYTTTATETTRSYLWAPQITQFGRIEAKVRFRLSRWDANPNAFYNLLYLSRNSHVSGHAYAEVNLREKGKINNVVLVEQVQNKVIDVTMVPGQSYDVHYVYDAANRVFALTVKDLAGRVIGSHSTPLAATARTIDLTLGARKNQAPHLAIQFSEFYVDGTDHTPLWGTWSNLVVAGYP